MRIWMRIRGEDVFQLQASSILGAIGTPTVTDCYNRVILWKNENDYLQTKDRPSLVKSGRFAPLTRGVWVCYPFWYNTWLFRRRSAFIAAEEGADGVPAFIFAKGRGYSQAREQSPLSEASLFRDGSFDTINSKHRSTDRRYNPVKPRTCHKQIRDNPLQWATFQREVSASSTWVAVWASCASTTFELDLAFSSFHSGTPGKMWLLLYIL